MTPDALKRWRKTADLSQGGLAALLGVDVMTVSRWERGERELPAYLHWALYGMTVAKVVPSIARQLDDLAAIAQVVAQRNEVAADEVD